MLVINLPMLENMINRWLVSCCLVVARFTFWFDSPIRVLFSTDLSLCNRRSMVSSDILILEVVRLIELRSVMVLKQRRS